MPISILVPLLLTLWCPTQGAAVIQHLMSELIREHSQLFSKDRDTDDLRISRPAPMSHRHSNHAEWVCSELDPQESDSHLEMAADCLSSPHLLALTPCSQQLSLPLTSERRVSSHSPRERRMSPFVTETVACQMSAAMAMGASLPDPQCYSPAASNSHSPQDSGLAPQPPPASPPSPALPETAVLEGPSQQPADLSGVEEEPSWTAETDLAGNSGSSDAQDSILSIYDNMDTMPYLVGGGEGNGDAADTGSGVCTAEAEGGTSAAGSASSWSSCEVLLQDAATTTRSGSGGPASPCQASVSFPSLFREDHEDGDAHPNSPASSSAPTDAPLSTGSSEVFLPSAPPDPHIPPTATHAMHCLLAGLRQQMARQKAEYEARIQR